LFQAPGSPPGSPTTNPDWVTRCKVPMSDATVRRLAELDEEMSTAERKVSPMQVAAQLMEEALGRVGVKRAAPEEENTGDPQVGEQAPPKPIEIRPPRDSQSRDEGRPTPEESLTSGPQGDLDSLCHQPASPPDLRPDPW
jgi:hypothetical protein